MPTIKRKVEMNLPQLIEWAWDNKIRSKTYRSLGGAEIEFSEGDVVRVYRTDSDDTFAVEFEEEITEDTVIPKLLTTFKKIYLKDDFGYQRVRIDEDFKIQLMLNKAEAHREKIETLHMVNDDGTHTLLWHDGKLVE